VKVCKPCLIRLAEEMPVRERALAFMKKIAQERHKCAPPPPPQIILIAETEDQEVLGTISLEFRLGGILFPVEEIYDFDHDVTPWTFDRNRLAQFGRWMTATPGISTPLMYAATTYALDQGKTHGLTEVKEVIYNLVRNMGIHLKEIESLNVRLENIPEEGRNYYLEDPPPRLYMVDLLAKKTALKLATENAVRSGLVRFKEV
jgi:hypothetical protein